MLTASPSLVAALLLLAARVTSQPSGVDVVPFSVGSGSGAVSAFVSVSNPRRSLVRHYSSPLPPVIDGRTRLVGGCQPGLAARNCQYLQIRPRSAVASGRFLAVACTDRDISHSHAHSHIHPHSHSSRLNRLTLLSIVCWLVSMTSLLRGSFYKLRCAGILSFVLGLPTLLPMAHRALFVNRRVDASCMMLGASVGALLLQDYAEAAAVSSLFAVSQLLEQRASKRSEEALSAVVRDLGPATARLLKAPTAEEKNTLAETIVPAADVAVASTLSVPVGDKVPCDGLIMAGTTAFDESLITGESRPLQRSVGDTVPAGAINSGPTRIILRTTAKSDESTVARLAKLVDDSRKQTSKTETELNRIAALYAPPIFCAALLACTLPWLLNPTNARKWTHRGLVLMVASCPCPLVISTPVTYVAGLANAARSGIIAKGGAVLETLGKVNKVALDKTGTLTEGRFALKNLRIADGSNRTKIMEHLALIESPSSHPLATALVDAANKEGISIPKDSTAANHTIIEGEGVTANINGKTVHAGNSRLFHRLGLLEAIPEADKNLVHQWALNGETVGFMSIQDEGIVCQYSIADGVRTNAKETIQKLQDMGIQVCMITGDRHEAAKSIADQVSLPSEQVYSELLPKEKLDIISQMKTVPNDCIMMCGDGVNDAPALALADVGVAIGSGAALATETSDVMLTDQDLNKLVCCIKLGRRAVRTIKQNIAFSLVAKGVVVGLAAFGITSLWAAIASDVGTMLIVTGNGLRLLPPVRKMMSEQE